MVKKEMGKYCDAYWEFGSSIGALYILIETRGRESFGDDRSCHVNG